MAFYGNRHLIRAICLMWSLYTIGVECGVDLTEYLNGTFITDCAFSSNVNRCECSTFAHTKFECTHTAFGDRVSKLLLEEKYEYVFKNCLCLEFSSCIFK